MSELEMLVIPEHIDATGDYVTATYYLQTGRNVDIVKKISSIAVEQTTGTWVAVPEETRRYGRSMWPKWSVSMRCRVTNMKCL